MLDQSHVTIKSINLVNNVTSPSGPIFEFSLERPLNVSAEVNGNLSSQFNFEVGKQYHILMNFIKNTTNVTKDAEDLATQQLLKDLIFASASTKNATLKAYLDFLLFKYYRLRMPRPPLEFDNPFVETSIYQ